MVFKVVGVILLLLALYLAFQSFALVSSNDGSRTLVCVLVAIFLVLTVRVLQAEKHHRDERAGTDVQRSLAPHQSRPGSPDDWPEQDSEPAHTSHANEGAPWLGR